MDGVDCPDFCLRIDIGPLERGKAGYDSAVTLGYSDKGATASSKHCCGAVGCWHYTT